jgi:Heterokaryon incompatibility protein (HET)
MRMEINRRHPISTEIYASRSMMWPRNEEFSRVQILWLGRGAARPYTSSKREAESASLSLYFTHNLLPSSFPNPLYNAWTMPGKFSHSSLTTSSSFRVIKLNPALIRWSPVSLELLDVKLKDTIPFEALSYAWEGQEPSKAVICNGKELLVTRTCDAALRTLRNRWTPRFLWIDSICINQVSIQERSQQVKLMGSIYSMASRVVVWLGERNPRRDLILKDIK